nr:DUF924 family protein [Caenimonas sedimenti]
MEARRHLAPGARAEPSEVLQFWREAGPDQWFRKDAAFDERFRQRFMASHEAAAGGGLDAWAQTPEGSLSLLILLDQFPRNAFRDSPRMYATDAKAREIARAAASRGWPNQVEPELRQFFALPFQHSEQLADHEQSVAIAESLGGEALRYARHHRDIIERFGRFPHRNALLGRSSTPQEEEFLRSGGFAG